MVWWKEERGIGDTDNSGNMHSQPDLSVEKIFGLKLAFLDIKYKKRANNSKVNQIVKVLEG